MNEIQTETSREIGCTGCAGVGCLGFIILVSVVGFAVYEVVKLIVNHIRIV